jgi:two-component system, NtrC family, sensor kinase
MTPADPQGRALDAERLARLVAAAHSLILIVDATHHVLFLNDEMVELCGDGVKVGEDLLASIPEQEQAMFLRHLHCALGGEQVTGCELSLRTAHDGILRALFNLASDGDIVIGVGQDATAIKHLEHQVIQAEKLATLGQLAAGVVHEINNPLTSITVYADYLAKKHGERGDPADVAMLEKILEGSERILKCARDLVNYAKPSVARLDVLSLNEVVRQSVSFCEHILKKASAELEIATAAELPPLYGVKDQLQQVLINLITNACHALPPQGGRVRISTFDLHNGTIAVEVRDNGSGIEEQSLSHIFEPFFTTKAAGEGTGLGLSIVKKIVDFHEGSIMVEARPGCGAIFCITLPTRRHPDERREA